MAKVESVEQAICPECEQEICGCGLGEKRVCPICDTRFYDLGTRSRKPKCPECGEVYIRDSDCSTLKTKMELDADGTSADSVVGDDYDSDEVDDNVKDEDSELDEDGDEDSDADVIPATDEVELKIEDEDDDEGGANPRKNYTDGSIGDDLHEVIMDDDDDKDDIELDGESSVPK